jgi:hypothetical protein
VCFCSLRCPTCKALSPDCHLWHVRLYDIFPHYLSNGTIFEKKLLNTKCVFWFYIQILSGIFLILRRIQRYVITNVHITCYVITNVHISCYSWQILMKLGVFPTDFREILEHEFHEYPSGGSRNFQWGRTDIHDEANIRFSQFSRKRLKNIHFVAFKNFSIFDRHPRCMRLMSLIFSLPREFISFALLSAVEFKWRVT